MKADGMGGDNRTINIDGTDTSLSDFKIEGNEWRPVDRRLQDWTTGWKPPFMGSIKEGAVFEEGGSVEGDFQIYLVGFESASNLVVRGS